MQSNAFDWHALPPGSALTRWAMAAPEVTPWPGHARPMEDRVDYVFRNGWTDTGDLPCREALRQALPHRRPERPQGPFDRLHPGLDGPQVDFSTFRHRPVLIRHGLRCHLRAATPGPARFRLTTCGGVRIWLEDDPEPVAVFEPFTRNRLQSCEVTLELTAQPVALTLALEDLHERDTTCAVSMTLLEGPALETAVPGMAQDPAVLAQQLGAIGLNAVFHEAHPAQLVMDPPPEHPLVLEVSGLHPFARGGLSVNPAAGRQTRVTLTPDASAAHLFDVGDTAPGCLPVEIAVTQDGVRVARRLGTTNLPPGQALTGDLAARKAQAAQLIVEGDGFDPSRATLLALRGEAPEAVARILDAALTTIEERQDCSDFTILPLLRLWRDGRNALDADRQARLRAAVLGYRYWMTEPGDDVMWFWSENHVLCFHVAQAVAGQLFPDAVFTNSGRSGAEHAQDAQARLTRWFDAIDRDGLCEWNSAAYYPIDLLGLFTLHDMVPALRDRARAVLDRIFAMTALHTSGTTPAGSQGRCYEKELLAGPCTELGSVAAIAFGAPFRPGYDRAAALFCLSDYAPTAEAAALVTPLPGTVLQARYTQGHAHAGKLSLWKSAQGQLSTVCALPAGDEGHQAQVLDVQMAAHPMARLWINHPGELKPWGDRRPSLLAGSHVVPQVAQYGPVALVIQDLDRDWTEIPFAQLFATRDAFAPPRRVGEWWVFETADSATGPGGAVAAKCSAPLAPAPGLYAGSLWRATGPRLGWVVTLAMPGEDSAGLDARLQRTAPRFDAAALRLEARGSDGAALSLAFDGTLSVDGTPRPFAPLTPEPHVARNGGPLQPWRRDGRD
ncbi:hypothetical protein [Pseudoponticoccus marisrubri]|uniref:Uncharacterized protein n=1 Tax=Pseudoponticoccus marisrubri TaxID=1685382 RepID=A0A0W7WFD8_9RHOB|nr:hypothetical protein [Pseudoponticoccus marisrubri]KUF09360.1 hypothetical protein AVJ23_18120 [Pseudoponticoccus marisrubri]